MPLLYKTWNEFFDAKASEGGPFQTLVNGSFEPFNAATRRHLGSSASLLSSIVASKYNFFIVAGNDQNIQVIHSLILVSPALGDDPILLGYKETEPCHP